MSQQHSQTTCVTGQFYCTVFLFVCLSVCLSVIFLSVCHLFVCLSESAVCLSQTYKWQMQATSTYACRFLCLFVTNIITSLPSQLEQILATELKTSLGLSYYSLRWIQTKRDVNASNHNYFNWEQFPCLDCCLGLSPA